MTEYLTTRELAELLRIKERKVYDLAASGRVPCSKAMGKLLFPKDAVEKWLAAHGGDFQGSAVRAAPDVFLGSHDPLLEWALRESRSGLATYFDGSMDGLRRFAERDGIAAGLHLLEEESGDWNIPFVSRECGTMPAVLVSWAERVRGLILREGLPHLVRSMADLHGLKVAPRQPEAGAQRLFQVLAKEAGLAEGEFETTAPARSEADAALAVAEGRADAAFGLAALAAQYRLTFVPLVEERFDLLVDRRAWFEAPMQRLLDFCTGPEFRDRAQGLDGYDIRRFGEVRFNGP